MAAGVALGVGMHLIAPLSAVLPALGLSAGVVVPVAVTRPTESGTGAFVNPSADLDTSQVVDSRIDHYLLTLPTTGIPVLEFDFASGEW